MRTPWPWGQRVLIYWAAITLGPLLLGVSLSLTSYAVSASKGLVGVMPGGVGLLLELLQFVLVGGGMAAMFHYIPNTQVRWGHAWMGGLFVATGIELAKRGLTLYLSSVPTYSAVYGAFATFPILLIWIYTAWVIVLLGAALTAYVPSLIAGIPRRRVGQGWQFQLALEVLKELDLARVQPAKGLTVGQLCGALQTESLSLEPVLDALTSLDWAVPLREGDGVSQDARYVLLIEPQATLLAPLVDALLLPKTPVTHKLWQTGRWPSVSLRDAL
ncbi:MAG: hypothetical protein CFE44_17250 [Burkholderiales bacterium PBB4]|nr:MAG: hypothetical protein CFE44_17250 [Burkholderiales bacterium PBB4]